MLQCTSEKNGVTVAVVAFLFFAHLNRLNSATMDFWIIFVLPFLVLVAPKLTNHVILLFLRFHKRTEKRDLICRIKEFEKEMSTISQVNEFAKYSKIQRKLRATSDQLSGINRHDLELNFKLTLFLRAFIYLLALILSVRFLYQIYQTAVSFILG